MALTRGDKMIILGAVMLAASVVMGLALLKKPQLFSSAPVPQPEMAVPVAIPPAPASTTPAAQPVSPPASAGSPAVVISPPPGAAPAAVPAQPAAPTATPPAATAKPTATGAAGRNALAGDETLERMFAEISRDGSPAAKPAESRPAGPEPAASDPQAAPGATPVVVAEPQAAPAPPLATATSQPSKPARDAAPAKTPAAPAPAAKKTAKAKPAAPESRPAPAPTTTAKPAGAAASGDVVRLIAEDKAGEYVLTIHTNRPPAQFHKMYMADPPRMVLDLTGSWTYHGPMSKATGEPFIRQIRVGRHPDMFRVVLDMAPDALSKLRGTPTVDRVPEGVVLRIPK